MKLEFLSTSKEGPKLILSPEDIGEKISIGMAKAILEDGGEVTFNGKI